MNGRARPKARPMHSWTLERSGGFAEQVLHYVYGSISASAGEPCAESGLIQTLTFAGSAANSL